MALATHTSPCPDTQLVLAYLKKVALATKKLLEALKANVLAYLKKVALATNYEFSL